VEGGVRGGLALLAAAVVASTADRSWERLKICAEDSCQWAFLDSSKNRSKHWCSMQECGNRSKTRAYRARRASGGTGR
jgi:predicted RNA-binding Zn ribbon-like protein